ncbi:MFS transporter [Vibrio sp. 10N.261.51.F12]|uniref:MFS transporter n=1 Tax=Vibrio sp. 10N.261.51.F12 TaxID=3229679 RepID=UPI00354EB45A
MNSRSHFDILCFVGIMLLALNLRAPFTSFAPLVDQLMNGLNLSSSLIGIVTALPLVMFALFSPLCPRLISKIGLEKVLCLALMLIFSGVLIRSSGSVIGLYLGTASIGIGIAFGNVSLPVVVKLSFAARIGVMTSLYTLTMGIGATASSALMVPLSYLAFWGFEGWQIALMFNLVFPILAFTYWGPKVGQSRTSVMKKTHAHYPLPKLIKQPMAWFITLVLGLNSFTFYTLAGWIPKILIDWSYSELQAGYIYSLLQFSTIMPGLVLAPLMARGVSSFILIKIAACMSFTGVLGLVLAPHFAVAWVVLFGFGNCATFIVALSFISLRTHSPGQAATLSGMAQSVGYALAAVGPSLIGSLHQATSSWHIPIALVAFFAFMCFVFAWLTTLDIELKAN